MQRTDTMQVRIDRQHRVEKSGEPVSDDALADRLARREGRVLPHITEVWRYQREVTHTEVTRTACRQQQLHQFLVRPIQRTQQNDARGQRDRQAQLKFSVRKAMTVDQRRTQTRGQPESCRVVAFVVEVQQHQDFCEIIGPAWSLPVPAMRSS